MSFKAKFLSDKNFILIQSNVVFVLAFLVRIVFFIYHGSFSGGDTPDYLKYADNIYKFGAYSAGDPPDLVPSIRRPPLYPHFLAYLQWLQGGVLSIQSIVVAQITLDSFVAVAIFLLARKVVSKPVALFMAIVYVFHPDAIFRPTAILTESLTTFMLTAAVLVFAYAFEKKNAGLIGLGAALLGITVLCRPLFVFVPVGIILIVLFKLRSPQRYVYAGVIAGVFLLTLTPWLIRNYQVSGQFVFIQRAGTANLLYGSLPDTLDNTESQYNQKLKAARTNQEVFEADKFGQEETINIILDSPKDYLLMRSKMYPYLFLTSFDDFTGVNMSFRDVYREKAFFVLAVKIGLLIFLALLPFLLSWVGLYHFRNNMTAVLCASVWFLNLLIHLPLWIEYRFWAPVIPFQLVSAGVGFTVLKEWFLKRRETTERS